MRNSGGVFSPLSERPMAENPVTDLYPASITARVSLTTLTRGLAWCFFGRVATGTENPRSNREPCAIFSIRGEGEKPGSFSGEPCPPPLTTFSHPYDLKRSPMRCPGTLWTGDYRTSSPDRVNASPAGGVTKVGRNNTRRFSIRAAAWKADTRNHAGSGRGVSAPSRKHSPSQFALASRSRNSDRPALTTLTGAAWAHVPLQPARVIESYSTGRKAAAPTFFPILCVPRVGGQLDLPRTVTGTEKGTPVGPANQCPCSTRNRRNTRKTAVR